MPLSRSLLRCSLLALAALQLQAQAIQEDAAKAMEGRSITYIIHKKPDFTAMTAGKGAFALFGAFAMVSAGNKLAQENDIQDPALSVSEDLVKRFAKAHAMQVVAPSTEAIDVKGVDRVLERCPSADYVLDIQTLNWGFSYFPTDWSHYRVFYGMRVSLIDVKGKSAIASGKASRTPDKTPEAPTKDELMASGAALLKGTLSKHSLDCEEEVATKVFGLPAQVVDAPAAATAAPTEAPKPATAEPSAPAAPAPAPAPAP